MSSRLEFVTLATAQGANIRALCRSFGISPQTAYKLLARFKEQGIEGLQERSRKPHSSPRRSSSELESQVLALHEKYPCWGARKLATFLPEDARPHPNTISAILRRHGRQVAASTNVQSPAIKRFEHEAPNLLWQMDFKGHFALTDPQAGRCYPLETVVTGIGRRGDNSVVLDDPKVSRYHATIIDTGASFVINDLRSANGVQVAGERIRGSATLSDGDVIGIAGYRFTFELAPAESPAP